jgi:pimeloyl-ACP methyl ester carboxylesterase
MSTFVFVHGGWGGGWSYKQVARRLRALGHEVYTPTLTGLGERAHVRPAGPAVDLDFHIRDILAVLRWEDLTDVWLVGHSYGGFVITGVADRAPERIGALVYVDAYVPENGDSCWSLAGDALRPMLSVGVTDDGTFVEPPEGLDSRFTAQTVASFRQPIVLHGEHRRIARKVYVRAARWLGSPFVAVHRRLQNDPAWSTHVVDCGHDVAAAKPDELAAILEAEARGSSR